MTGGPNAETIAASHSSHTRVKSSSRSSLRESGLLRSERPTAEGSVQVPPTPFDDRYGVRGSKVARVRMESARTAVPVFHRPLEGIRLCRPHTSLAGARSLWSTTVDDRRDPPILRLDESLRAE